MYLFSKLLVPLLFTAVAPSFAQNTLSLDQLITEALNSNSENSPLRRGTKRQGNARTRKAVCPTPRSHRGMPVTAPLGLAHGWALNRRATSVL